VRKSASFSHLFAFALAVALPQAPARAFAAPPAANDATAKEAKSIGRAGLTLFDKGDYAGALENFKRAYAMYPVPTLGVFTARSLEKLGRLREARDIYAKVAETPLEKNAEDAFKRAVDEAKHAATDVAARIPTVTLTVRGRAAPVTATLDEKPINVGEAIEVDPGDHKLEASAGGRTEKASAHVEASEKREVAIDLTPLPAPIVARSESRSSSSPLKTIGFVGLAIGGAGMLAGGGLGIGAILEKSSLDKPGACATRSSCTPSVSNKVDTYNTLRTSSAVALYAGAGVAAIGVALIIAAPRTSDARAARLVITPNEAHLEGRF
jgi:tetratricopeptide (TPR) repeat protein